MSRVLFFIILFFTNCAGGNIRHDVRKTPFNEYYGKKVKSIQPANINGYGYGCDLIIYFTDGSKLILSCTKYKMRACQ